MFAVGVKRTSTQPRAGIEIAQLAPTFAVPTMFENGLSASVDQMSIFGYFNFIVERWSCRRQPMRRALPSTVIATVGLADADDVL